MVEGKVTHKYPLQTTIETHLIREFRGAIGLNEASKISGLSRMQLVYLRMGRLISIQLTDPTKPHGKANHAFYSESEMKQIAEIRKSLIEEKR